MVEVAPDLPFFSSVVKAQGAIRIEIPASVISVTVDTPSGNIDVRGINVRKLSLRTRRRLCVRKGMFGAKAGDTPERR